MGIHFSFYQTTVTTLPYHQSVFTMVNRRILLFTALMVMVLSAANAADADTAAYQKKMTEIASQTCKYTCRKYYDGGSYLSYEIDAFCIKDCQLKKKIVTNEDEVGNFNG